MPSSFKRKPQSGSKKPRTFSKGKPGSKTPRTFSKGEPGSKTPRTSSKGKPGGRGARRPADAAKGPLRKRKKPAGKGFRPRVKEEADDARGERLQKVLAAAGMGSRRNCEELILAARVEIDRKVVTELGTRVDATRQEIRVDGVVLPKARTVYYALNKPDGVICSNRDPGGRPRVIDLMPTKDVRLFTVGRLDLHSEGLILLTNDGELANRLTHPRYGIQKVYRVLVAGNPTREAIAQLRSGIHLAEAFVRVPNVAIKSQNKQSAVLEMVLEEGRNREIRRVMARIGHKVLRLARIAVGPIKLGDLPPGESRRLSREEVRELKEVIKMR